jgi:toxin FitB
VSGWLLDTNIVSELRKPRPERKVIAFMATQSLHRLFISEITLAEIRFGVERATSPARRAEVRDWLAHKLRPMFEGRVLAVTEDILFTWRMIIEEGRKAGHTFSQPDLLIAATALHHGLTVVTRNAGDFKIARAPVFNPWADPSPSA